MKFDLLLDCISPILLIVHTSSCERDPWRSNVTHSSGARGDWAPSKRETSPPVAALTAPVATAPETACISQSPMMEGVVRGCEGKQRRGWGQREGYHANGVRWSRCEQTAQPGHRVRRPEGDAYGRQQTQSGPSARKFRGLKYPSHSKFV